MNRIIALKVDVDTYQGMQNGVPRLAALFKAHGVRGSFFVPMGKDHTGRTVKRVFTRRGFLSKAGRVGVVKTYGIKTLLYGLVLPGPEIALGNAETLRALVHQGHEVGIHGLDHVDWHDHIKELGRKKTEEILAEASSVYTRIMGHAPLSFAAPGWMTNQHAIGWLEAHGFAYTSDVRGYAPFMPKFGGRSFNLLQVPTTLPTLDEVVGREGNDQKSLLRFFLDSVREDLNVLTVHAELEGKDWLGLLDGFITETLNKGFRYERLVDIADTLKNSAALPVCEIEYGFVDGRAGEVTIQQEGAEAPSL